MTPAYNIDNTATDIYLMKTSGNLNETAQIHIILVRQLRGAKI